MATDFTSNTFEHDYIIAALDHYRTDLATGEPEPQVTDKYAVALTAFMVGEIRQAVKNVLQTN